MDNEKRVLEIFRESGALLEGHFVLRSGLRSRQFFQCAQVCQYMDRVSELASMLLEKLQVGNFETVLAPAMGGLVIGQEVARQAGVRFVFAEKVEDRLVLRRGFKIAPGERILVVEDVVTRGGRAKEALQIVEAHGGEAAGLAVLVDRTSGKAEFPVPFVPLVRLEVETFDPNHLPEDLKRIPAVKPGS